ncbi:MAG: cyclic nucleotide-binding domain-containing protein [Cruoricaptor ignavus]|nr:cyclic nucleotide-binding domain-containing protein [Cruoricaptor ignavus]
MNNYQLINRIKKIVDIEINKKDTDKILSIFKPAIQDKNIKIITQGEVCRNIYFVLEGAIRTFTLNDNGREYTRTIAIENDFISNISSFKNSTPSDEFIEKTKFLYANHEDIYNLISTNSLLKDIYIEIIESFNIQNVNKINKILTLSDHDKLNFLYKNKKDFIKRFPDRINASFLSMSRENYSRYKKIVIF